MGLTEQRPIRSGLRTTRKQSRLRKMGVRDEQNRVPTRRSCWFSPQSLDSMHNHINSQEVTELIRELALVCEDTSIVSILNRLGYRGGNSNTWTEKRNAGVNATAQQRAPSLGNLRDCQQQTSQKPSGPRRLKVCSGV